MPRWRCAESLPRQLIASNDRPSPADAPDTALDPASLATTPGTGGGNLVGTCDGDGKSASELMGRPMQQDSVPAGAYQVVMRHATCELASVADSDVVEVSVAVTLDTTSKQTLALLHSTITNVTDETLVFDMASPTLTLTAPKPFPETFNSMFAERPILSNEELEKVNGTESWGGTTLGTDGVSSQVTPVLIGGPQPGNAASLALQRDFDDTWYVPDSAAKVWLRPGDSFQVESDLSVFLYGSEPVYGPDVPVTDAHIAALFSGDISGLSPRFSLSLFNPDGTARTLLVDRVVPMTVEH